MFAKFKRGCWDANHASMIRRRSITSAKNSLFWKERNRNWLKNNNYSDQIFVDCIILSMASINLHVLFDYLVWTSTYQLWPHTFSPMIFILWKLISLLPSVFRFWLPLVVSLRTKWTPSMVTAALGMEIAFFMLELSTYNETQGGNEEHLLINPVPGSVALI